GVVVEPSVVALDSGPLVPAPPPAPPSGTVDSSGMVTTPRSCSLLSSPSEHATRLADRAATTTQQAADVRLERDENIELAFQSRLGRVRCGAVAYTVNSLP